jgi:hypothetical protein
MLPTPENDPYPAIYDALNCLMDALNLPQSESSTEHLFAILALAFSGSSLASMRATLASSHKDGLCYDMRGPIALALVSALHDHPIPF